MSLGRYRVPCQHAAMPRKKTSLTTPAHTRIASGYDVVLRDIVGLLENARHAAARSVNSVMTATYWMIGRCIVESEQGGRARAGYGEKLVASLSRDLTARFGRGFGRVNLAQMKRFHLSWPADTIFQTLSEKSAEPIAVDVRSRPTRK